MTIQSKAPQQNVGVLIIKGIAAFFLIGGVYGIIISGFHPAAMFFNSVFFIAPSLLALFPE